MCWTSVPINRWGKERQIWPHEWGSCLPGLKKLEETTDDQRGTDLQSHHHNPQHLGSLQCTQNIKFDKFSQFLQKTSQPKIEMNEFEQLSFIYIASITASQKARAWPPSRTSWTKQKIMLISEWLWLLGSEWGSALTFQRAAPHHHKMSLISTWML